MKNLFQPPNEGKQKAKISLQTNNTIDTNNDTIKENTFSNFANIFKLPQRSPSSTREKILTMNRTNSSSNYNFNKNKNLANYTYHNYTFYHDSTHIQTQNRSKKKYKSIR